MSAHNDDLDQVLTGLNTDRKTGLSTAEAAARLEQYGPNQLQGKKKKPIAVRFLNNS